MAVALGLLVAVTYGVGDFFGGMGAKRNPPRVVVARSQMFGLVAMGVAVLVDRGSEPIGDDVLAGAAAGSVGVIGVVLLYRGLAGGKMSVIAPITAVGAAVLPLVWGLLRGERPSAVALAGVGLALTAVALVSMTDETDERPTTREDLVLALTAGAAFGVVFILLSTTGTSSGMWPVLAARITSVSLATLVVLAGAGSLQLAPGSLPTIITAGVLDAGANALYVLAAREGLVSLVAVLSSLYPAATVVLARLVLAERMSSRQLVGIVLALGGVLLIAAG